MRKSLVALGLGAIASLVVGVTPALASPTHAAAPPPPVACGTKVFLSNTSVGAVDVWESGDFAALTFGHTDFCEVYAYSNGVTYHELESYGVAGSTGDCLSDPGGVGAHLGLNGCNSDHQADEEWATTGTDTYNLAHGTGDVVTAYLNGILTLSALGGPAPPQNWVIVPG